MQIPLTFDLNIAKPTKDYTVLGYLGQGEYGSVNRIRMNTGEEKAEKITFSGGKHLWHLNVTEMNILKGIDHPNILKADKIIHSSDVKDCSTTMILPLANCDLDSLAKKHYPEALNYQQSESKSPNLFLSLTTPTCTPTGTPTSITQSSFVTSFNLLLKYLYQAAYGVYALHMAGFLHLDIKGANVLIFGNTAKIADFSTSAATGGRKSLTMGFVKCCDLARPPENKAVSIMSANTHDALKAAEYSQATDVWSFGVLILSTFIGGADNLWSLLRYSDVTQFVDRLIAPSAIRGKLLNILAESFKPLAKRASMLRIVELLEELITPNYRIQRKVFQQYDNLIAYYPGSKFTSKQENSIKQLVKDNSAKFAKELDELRTLALKDNIYLQTWLLVIELYYQSISLERKSVVNRHLACYWLALRLFQEKCYESRQSSYVNESVNKAEITLLTHFDCCLYRRSYLASLSDLSRAKVIHDLAVSDPDKYCNSNLDKIKAVDKRAVLSSIKDITK